MAYTNIDDPSVHFQTALYTGNGGTLAVTNDGNSDLQPDLVWTKKRSDTSHNALVDSSRGATKQIYSNLTAAEETVSGVTAFNTDGFTLGSNGTANGNGGTFVAWQWKCNGGTTSSLSGNLASVVQVNADAGFSIVKYTGSGGNGQSVLHGLGLTPEVIITKARNGTDDWYVYHKSIGNTKILKLNTTGAEASSSVYDAAAVSSSAFFVSANLIYVGELGADFVSYCFAPIQGYSKFGSYVGNGTGTSDGTFDGTFVYTGFKPAWVMVKRSSYSAGDGWFIYDNKRPRSGSTGNYINNKLAADSAGAESGNVYDAVDFLSNGFKLRTGRAGSNASGSTYIYMAFAENPFTTSTGIPTTAR